MATKIKEIPISMRGTLLTALIPVGAALCFGVPPEKWDVFRQAVRPWLELVNFAAGPVAAVLAWKALRQVKVAAKQLEVVRQNAIDTAKRDSLKVTAEQTRRFAEKVLPMAEEFYSAQKAGGYKAFSASKVTITDHPFNVNIEYDLVKVNAEAQLNDLLIYRLANEIEGIAMHLVTGIADEEAAFGPLGLTFCDVTKSLMPFTAPRHEQARMFCYTLRLFQVWHVRAARLEAETQAAAANQKAKSLQTARVQIVGVDTACRLDD